MLALPLLAVASAYDVCRRRIPNGVTLASLVAGTASAGVAGGLRAALAALAAAALVMLVLIPIWRFRALGGGDVKLAISCAAWVGLERLVPFAFAAAVAGGIVAVACIVLSTSRARREIAANLQLAARRAMPAVTIQQESGRVSVPYGAAIAVGAMWVLVGG